MVRKGPSASACVYADETASLGPKSIVTSVYQRSTRDNNNFENAKHVRGRGLTLVNQNIAVIEKNEKYVTLLEITIVFTNIMTNNAFLGYVKFLLEIKETIICHSQQISMRTECFQP